MTLPLSIPGDFELRCVIPKIWTQETSRAFGIYWSKRMNHGILYPSPSEEELNNFYKQAHYDRYLSGESAVRFEAPMTPLYRVIVKIAFLADRSAADPLPTLFRLASSSPSVCDLGCGGGTFLESIRDRSSCVVGVDPSPVSAKALQSRQIEFHAGTADDLPSTLPRGAFDVVTMFHSLEHVRNVGRSLRNVRSLLKPGGLAVIEVPNMDCLGFRTYPEVWIHTDAGRHLQFFTEASLAAALQEAGFDPLETEFTGFTHQFLPGRTRKMQVHWDILFKDGATKPVSPRASRWTALACLLRQIIGVRQVKYDIVRIYARLR